MIKCYDPEGKEHLKEPIDARECVEHCGFTLEPPEQKEVPKIEEKADVEEKAEEKKKAGRPPRKR